MKADGPPCQPLIEASKQEEDEEVDYHISKNAANSRQNVTGHILFEP